MFNNASPWYMNFETKSCFFIKLKDSLMEEIGVKPDVVKIRKLFFKNSKSFHRVLHNVS